MSDTLLWHLPRRRSAHLARTGGMRMGRLQGKRALITGGTSGIGLETARRFLGEGARVAITGSNEASVGKALGELGPSAIGMAADAGDLAAQRRVADWVRAQFGGLDTLFVNAGI